MTGGGFTTFCYVSQLQKCMVNNTAVVSLKGIQTFMRLNYDGRTVVILERKENVLQNKEAGLVEV